MSTVLVWLLIATSTGPRNTGNVSVIAKFQSAEQCEHVRKNIPRVPYSAEAVCIQANILKE